MNQEIIDYYNSIAQQYDSLYDDERSMQEDKLLKDQFLHRFARKKILDVGCGTGHFVTLCHETESLNYIGIEPCEQMLEVALDKHPKHKFISGAAETITKEQYQWADIVYYGYGSASYSDLNLIITNFLVNARTGTGLFIMLYNETANCRIGSSPKKYSHKEVKALIPNGIRCSIKPFINNNFINGAIDTTESTVDNSYWLVLKVYKEETGADVTEEELQTFIQANRWTNAKNYEQTAPHEYVVKGKLSAYQQRQFERVVMFIRRNGYQEKFGKYTYIYYNVGEHKYWTMGAPLYQTIILNRAKQ